MAHRRPSGHRGETSTHLTKQNHTPGRRRSALRRGRVAPRRGVAGANQQAPKQPRHRSGVPPRAPQHHHPPTKENRPAHLPVARIKPRLRPRPPPAPPHSPPVTQTTTRPKHTANPMRRDSYTAAAATAGTPATTAGTGGTGRRVSWKITASWTNSNRSGSPARISVEPRATTRGRPDDGSVNW